MRCSPLAAQLDRAGARWVESEGWRVVTDYGDPEKEVRAATRSLAVRDVSHFGRLEVSGKDAVDLLHRLTTNEVRYLQTGQGQINLFTNEKGRIVDRVLLLKLAERLLLLTSPGTAGTLVEWLDRFTFLEEIVVHDRTAETAALQWIGPDAASALQRRLGLDAGALPPWHFLQTTVDGRSVLAVCLDDLWLPSFLTIGDATAIRALAEDLVSEASLLGERAYEVLRIESGWGVYGKELSESTNPLEAGQKPFVSFTKGCYIGQEVVARLDTYEKVQRALVGLELEGSAGEESAIFCGGEEVGRITSVAYSPRLSRYIALAFVRRQWAEPGKEVLVRSRAGETPGRIASLPFLGEPAAREDEGQEGTR